MAASAALAAAAEEAAAYGVAQPGGGGTFLEVLLRRAAHNGDVERVQTLLRAGARVDSVGDCGSTALHLCVSHNQTSVLDPLL